MIRLRNITMKNFLSLGNVTQSVILDEHGLTLILGENVDLGGAGSRNGVGKTSIIQAISYALFGQPLTKIKVDNLINKTNKKSMVVSMDFDIDGRRYRIERGRKPNFLRYYVNDGLVNSPETDEAHGENKWTQDEIEKVIGMSHDLFKHIVALHTKTIPFLSMRDADQRKIIEELLSISKLSTKAGHLKDGIKTVKVEIAAEEVRIKTQTDSNSKIERTIADLRFQEKVWDSQHTKQIEKLQKAIDQLVEIDIDVEITNQKSVTEWSQLDRERRRLEQNLLLHERSRNAADNALTRIRSQITSAEDHACPTCGHELHDDKHENILSDYRKREAGYLADLRLAETAMLPEATALEDIGEALVILGRKPEVTYDSLEDALNHRHTLDKLRSDIERESSTTNPVIEQIANLSSSGLQLISYEYLNELTQLKEHQDYLLKLLTDRTSFIRKKIIDQNLNYLNSRLNFYLEKLQLPHEVEFLSDLSVEITNLGLPYDFEGLSNGEANRLVLALSWAFRDVWESQNQHLNFLAIDELIDSGMDESGMDAALELLKKNGRERAKNIFLISHKSDLSSRVSKILLVQKENGFTTVVSDIESNE